MLLGAWIFNVIGTVLSHCYIQCLQMDLGICVMIFIFFFGYLATFG